MESTRYWMQVSVGEMDDVDGGASHVRKRYRPVSGFGLGLGAARERVEVRRGLALGDHLRDDDVDRCAVLRVDATKSA